MALAGLALVGAIRPNAALPGTPSTGRAEQVTRLVDDDGLCGGAAPCYTTIDAAAKASGDHERIQVFPGRYTETVEVVNKALNIEGPGSGDPLQPDDPAAQAIWASPPGNLAPLLTVDARARGVDGPTVRGFRFRPAAIGILLVGRQAAKAPPWPVPPTSTITTRIALAKLSANLFKVLPTEPPSPPRVLVVIAGADDTIIEDSAFQTEGTGLWIEDSVGLLLKNNSVVAASAGAMLKSVRGQVTVTNNRLSGTNGAGTALVLMDVPGAMITANRLVSGSVGVRIVQSRAPTSDDQTSVAAFGGLVLGGQPKSGNVILGSDQALLLENAGAGAITRTVDVSATFNAWGTAYAPVVESRVRHAFDDPQLGRVTYWPALGVPAKMGLSAAPDSLPADGTSIAEVIATLRDVADGPAADDAIVAWSRNGPGQLLTPAGRLMEAESTSGSITRQGGWTTASDAGFGPPSGGSYLRTAEVGASLAFTATAGDVVLRYAGADGAPNAGQLKVEVDGVQAMLVNTRAPDHRWLALPIARGLGPGTHVLTLTLQSGEASVDLLAAGTRVTGGRAVAQLRAGAETGEATLTAETVGDAIHRLSIGLALVSPSPAALALSVVTSTLPVGGFTTTVTARLSDPEGQVGGDGTVIDFDALLGTITPGRTRVLGGIAQAVFTSGDDIGVAEVRATVSGLSATLPITLVAGPPARLALATNVTLLPANSLGLASLTITAFDKLSHPVPDGTPVYLATTLGTLEDQSGNKLGGSAVLRSSGGLIQARLRSGNVAGLAEIQATTGGRAGEGIGGPAAGPGATWQTVLVTMVAQDLQLTKSVEPHPPAVLTPGEPVFYSLNYANASTSTVPEVIVEDTLPSGLISPSLLIEGPPVEQITGAPNFRWRIERLRSGETGRIRVRAIVDTSLRWNSRTTVVNTAHISSPLAAELSEVDNGSRAEIGVVPGAAYTVTVSAPEALRVGGATGEVEATVMDRFGNPVIDGTAVFFTTDPALGQVSPGVSSTRRGVARTTFTSGTRRGTATVQALSVDNRAGLAEILLIAGAPRNLVLTPERPRLAAGGPAIRVSARVDDQYGNGVGGEALTFLASGGSVSPAAGISDATGDVTVTVQPGNLASRLTLTATAGASGLVRALEIPIDPGPPAALALDLDPAAVTLGERTTATATVTDPYGNPVPDELVVFSSTIGIVRQAVVRTGADGAARTLILSYRVGTGTVDASTTTLSASSPLAVVQSPLWIPLAFKPAVRPR